MSRILPPTPVMDSYAKKYGGMTEVFELFFDKNYNPLPNAPEDLKKETEMLRSTAPKRRGRRME